MNPSGTSPTIFVCDASAFGSRMADVLRTAGYVVGEVSPSMLASRVLAEKPAAVVLDVDAEDALVEVASVRQMPGSGSIDFIYMGSGGGAVKDTDDAISQGGSAFFLRPTEVVDLLRKIEALTGGPAALPSARASTPPPSIARSSDAGRDAPPSSERLAPVSPSLPAPGVRTPGPPLPLSVPSLESFAEPPRSLATFGTVSAELQKLLAEAEQRIEAAHSSDAAVTPEEEIEAVLPADVLASLDEPLDRDDDAEPGLDGVSHRPQTQEGGHRVTTSGGSRRTTTGSGSRVNTGAQTQDGKLTSDAPASRTGTGVPRKTTDAFASGTPTRGVSEGPGAARISQVPRTQAPITVSTSPAHAPARPPARPLGVREDPASSFLPPPPPPPPERGRPSAAPSPRGASAVLLDSAAARRFLAAAIAGRESGAIAFEQGGVVRRVVLRDGDLVTAASSTESESLVHYLAARGELGRDEAARLSAKVPGYGRHAGAALVAHGLLGQDELWTVLRAHAEWITSHVLRDAGTAELEVEPPGRLRAEPSVFGARAGPEVFVELVRRATPPEEAIEALGGGASRIGDGANGALLGECALSPHELEVVARSRGGTVSEVLARSPDPEIVCVVHALALLGVLDVAPGHAQFERPSADDAEIAALDDEALRGRVRARMEVVDEGDYFAVLGIGREATGYEVRRAYLELRRTFEPSRILTLRTRDLAEDVTKIVVVLDEAYEILRDPARRERYRRAIDAAPA